jgi:hypothetical protein
MSDISEAEKLHFHEKGWVSVPLSLSSDQIKIYFAAAKLMRAKAITDQYGPGRVYFDYLNDFNLAAIECPFNHKICAKEIKDLFIQIRLGSMIRSLMSWSDIYCSLARLFCMGDYNYRGNWHRDFENDKMNYPINRVQVAIYLENQQGFRYLKKEFDLGGARTLIPSFNDSDQIQQFTYPLSPPSYTFDVLDGNEGSVLFFDPRGFHQGSNFTRRTDFHMRFENAEHLPSERALLKNSFQDFELHDYLHSAYDIESPHTKIISDLGVAKRQPLKSRFYNHLNYKSGLFNIYKTFHLRKKLTTSVQRFGVPDLTANTFFQNSD